MPFYFLFTLTAGEMVLSTSDQAMIIVSSMVLMWALQKAQEIVKKLIDSFIERKEESH